MLLQLFHDIHHAGVVQVRQFSLKARPISSLRPAVDLNALFRHRLDELRDHLDAHAVVEALMLLSPIPIFSNTSGYPHFCGQREGRMGEQQIGAEHVGRDRREIEYESGHRRENAKEMNVHLVIEQHDQDRGPQKDARPSQPLVVHQIPHGERLNKVERRISCQKERILLRDGEVLRPEDVVILVAHSRVVVASVRQCGRDRTARLSAVETVPLIVCKGGDIWIVIGAHAHIGGVPGLAPALRQERADQKDHQRSNARRRSVPVHEIAEESEGEDQCRFPHNEGE